MRRLMFFRFGGPDVHLPKLIGAFVLFIGLLMFFRAGAVMFDSWNGLKYFPNCAEAAKSIDEPVVQQLMYSDCKDDLHKLTGVSVVEGQIDLTARQFITGLLGPIANLFFWAIIFIFGLMIYRTGTVVIPIEQSIREIPETRPSPRKTKK